MEGKGKLIAIYSDSMITNSPLLIILGQTPQKDDSITENVEE